MRIALIQQSVVRDKAANLARGVQAFEAAVREGADLIVYPELAFEWFHPRRPARGEVLSLAEPIPGPTTERFRELARRHRVAVVLNLFERDGDRAYDTSPVIDASGEMLGKTRMVHITHYEGFYERDYYAPGDLGAPVYPTAAGRVGVAICYDRHFPEYTRALTLNGAELIVVPQAGAVGEWPDGLFEAEMRVTAFQNGCFVALCNRVGREDDLEFAGESFVADPSGRIVVRAAAGKDDILIADLDLAAVERSHARRLFLRDRRPELYGDWLGRGEGRPPLSARGAGGRPETRSGSDGVSESESGESAPRRS